MKTIPGLLLSGAGSKNADLTAAVQHIPPPSNSDGAEKRTTEIMTGDLGYPLVGERINFPAASASRDSFPSTNDFVQLAQ